MASTRTNKIALPKTGQTTSYVDYDDGYYEKGSLINPRFVNNGDGTISDRVTGLMWVNSPYVMIPGTSIVTSNTITAYNGTWTGDGQSYILGEGAFDDGDSTTWICLVAHLSGPAIDGFAAERALHPTYWRQTIWTTGSVGPVFVYMDWTTAITNIEALDYAGYTDWRLPNIKELNSIVDYKYSGPCLDQTVWDTSAAYEFFVSSTTGALSTSEAWVQECADGTIIEKSKGELLYYRPVRGGV